MKSEFVQLKSDRDDELYCMKKEFRYSDAKTNLISFPLGGIGTGSIGLAGNGRLIDWEIFNRPNKNSSTNGFSFFAIKVEDEENVISSKILNGDINTSLIGNSDSDWNYGFGVKREFLAGMPHFKTTEFTGEFPVAKIKFIEENFPVEIELEAYNPFIPGNDFDSSIPCAILKYRVKNSSNAKLNVSIAGSLSNPFVKDSKNVYSLHENISYINLHSGHYKENDSEYGDLSISTDSSDVSYQNYWYRGEWFDNLTVFWKDFNKYGKLVNRDYLDFNNSKSWNATVNFNDVATLCSRKDIEPGETSDFNFILSWNFPNFVNYWNPGELTDGKPPHWKNYYATVFENSILSADYTWKNITRLYTETQKFKNTLFNSTYPDYVIEAVSANLSTLKTPTCIRLTDGTLYGFEGCNCKSGCCEGSCTHVWNYVQSTAFLFPALERSMRDIDYKENLTDSGKMFYRMFLPPGRERAIGPDDPLGEALKAAADGQMGGIIKTYREWIISGDTNWLKSIWPKVKKSLEYAWSPDNEYLWDENCSGVFRGAQHHTLDVNIYGPNSYITGYYLTALLAASKMAFALNDESHEKYFALYKKGRKWVQENLFNGEYFYQKIDLKDDKFPVDKEIGEIKYQIGEGCHIDQVIGQWHAHIAGLGYIFDKELVEKSLLSIYKYNFVRNIREIPNSYRVYSLNDESGVVMCSWPKENSPLVPVPYSSECMTGFEYQVASHMIFEGLIDEGLEIVRAIRERFEGEKRNPWNEYECGSNYARAMSSYSLILALSGFKYNLVSKHIGFSPQINRDKFYTFWSLGTAWGSYESDTRSCVFKVLSGEISLSSFSTSLLKNNGEIQIYLDDERLHPTIRDEVLTFEECINFNSGTQLRIEVLTEQA